VYPLYYGVLWHLENESGTHCFYRAFGFYVDFSVSLYQWHPN